MSGGVLFVLVLLLVAGNAFAQPSRPSDDLLEIRLQRTACYGECPVYTLSIWKNGRVRFEGTEYVGTKGPVHGKITSAKKDLLVAEIVRADFFSLKDAYTSRSGNCPITATDMPSVTLRIKLNGREKTIEHYLGCFETSDKRDELPIFPRSLVLLEDKIDEIVGTDRWIRKDK